MSNPNISFDDFQKVDLRAGTIVRVEAFPEARKPAWKVWVDLGEIGVKASSAQITDLYTSEDLLGRQVVCVVNLGPRRIGPFTSEVLVTGFPDGQGRVVLTALERKVPNGQRLF